MNGKIGGDHRIRDKKRVVTRGKAEGTYCVFFASLTWRWGKTRTLEETPFFFFHTQRLQYFSLQDTL